MCNVWYLPGSSTPVSSTAVSSTPISTPISSTDVSFTQCLPSVYSTSTTPDIDSYSAAGMAVACAMSAKYKANSFMVNKSYPVILYSAFYCLL